MNDGLYHLCLTQSPLISMVFRAAIRKMGIPPERVRSISRRSVKPVGEGVCLDGLSDRMEAAYKGFKRKVYRELKRELGSELERMTEGGPFHAYIPHTQRLMYQEVLAHPLCQGYCFVEEGFTSMSWEVLQTANLPLKKRLQNKMRSWWVDSAFDAERYMFDVSDPKFRGAVAISRNAFRGMEHVTDVSEEIHHYTRGEEPSRWFVVLDTSYLHRGILWQDYEDALVDAIAEASAEKPDVIVKFHFVDDKAVEHFEAIRARVEDKVGELTCVGRDFSVEEALRANDVVVFAVSSLGYYVSLFGGAVHCFANRIRGLDVSVWIKEGRLPEDFRKVVGLEMQVEHPEP